MSDTATSYDFGGSSAEIVVLLQNGDIEQAVRTSGELLASCDNELRTLHNAGQAADEAFGSFAEAAILHVHSLRLAKAPGDAFSCAVGALLTIEVYQAGTSVKASRKLRLYTSAIYSVIDCFDSIGDATESADEDHRGYILTYLASLLYHSYKETSASAPDDPSLPEAYRFLSAIKDSGAIQTPAIKLGNKDVDPAMPGPLLVDVMSRAAALGIYA